MAIYKRGDVYWYEFTFNGTRYRKSTNVGDQKNARQIEAAERVRLAKGEVGIREKAVAPTLAEFAPRFEGEVETACADKPATVTFYKEKLRRLLSDPILSGTRLDQIDEAAIGEYKQRRARSVSRYGKPLSPASINRELATLRKLLRLAQDWKQLDRAPRVRMLR
ncbi:MAG: int, partial [Bryobacterales bacterium]|nr:int [Bryobacterales bacterium]